MFLGMGRGVKVDLVFGNSTKAIGAWSEMPLASKSSGVPVVDEETSMLTNKLAGAVLHPLSTLEPTLLAEQM